MTTRTLPDYYTVMVSLTAWLSGLAIIAWVNLGATASVAGLIASLLLTAMAAGSAALIFVGGSESAEAVEDVRTRLVLEDLPAGRR